MPPKKDIKGAQKNPKQNFPLKDLLSPSIKQPPRDPRIIKPADPCPLEKKPEYKAYPLPQEWPGDEQARSFDFGIESQLKFTDNSKILTPASFSMNSSQITFWRRPKEFLLDEFEEKNEEKEVIAIQRRSSNPFEGKTLNPPKKGLPRSRFKSSATAVFDSGPSKNFEEFKIEDDIRIHSPKKRQQDIVLQLKVLKYYKK